MFEQYAEPAEFCFIWKFGPRYFLLGCIGSSFRLPHFTFACFPLPALSFSLPYFLPHLHPPQADLPVLCIRFLIGCALK